MSNETAHTFESLEALPRKADVVEIAEQMGLDSEGTRAEITARILEAQTGANGESSSSGGDDGSTDQGDSSDSSGGADEGAADDIVEADGYVGVTGELGVEGVAGEVAPPLPGKICDTGKVALKTVVESYFGVGEVDAEMEQVYADIEAGKQPCVVVGTGNARFALETFDVPFDCDNVARDVTDSVSANLARYLADKNLFPRG